MNPRIALADAIRIEQVEARAWLDEHAAAPPRAIEALGLRTRALGAVALLAADCSDSLLHNRAIGVGVLERADAALIEAITAHYAQTTHGFAINLSPFASPSDTADQLTTQGFRTYFHHVKWVRGAHPATPVASTLRVKVAAAQDARRYAETLHDADTPERDAQIEWAANRCARTHS